MWSTDRGNAAGSGTDGTDADSKTAGKAADGADRSDGAAGFGEQGSREPVYVTTPDKAALHLPMSTESWGTGRRKQISRQRDFTARWR